ncbi:MAG: right-handed parallel beta-helix repeat-containing protein [Deltaproteobacteria bacterium]|nr:right-handed parallel beta-helix repeat-containing protein [Deltaproteobacteria bacterium]
MLGLAVGVAASVACHRGFSCEQDTQCQTAQVLGRCEATGSCSFPDDSCPSGHRYGEHASASLVDVCVEPGQSGSGSSTGTVPQVETTSTGLATSDEPASTGLPGECPPLRESGPVVVMADGEVIEGLRITTDGVPGISVSGHSGVTIRDCEIHHVGAPGISFAAADALTIENVIVVHDRTEPGPHAHRNQANIVGSNSLGLVIDGVRVTRGSSGIELADTPGALLTMIEGHDVRGPGPPASFIQISESNDVEIDGFSCVNPLDTGRPSNLVELHESSNVIVRNGLLDGHNAEFGYGVLFEQTGGQHAGGLVEDVDVIRMTNGGFSGFPSAFDLVFRRTRARDNICEIVSVPIEGCSNPGPNDGCVPGSDGRSWTSAQGISGLLIEDSRIFGLCEHPVWPETAFVSCDGDGNSLPDGDCGLTEEDFVLRPPIQIEPCWELR